jgi:replication factor C large subunit
MVFLEKYAPKSISEMVGNQRSAIQVRDFIKKWTKGQALILSGPSGTGKSLTIRLAASELGLEIVEGSVEDVVESSKQMSIWRRGKLVAIDLDEGEFSASEISKLVEKSTWPICLVTQDIYEQRLYDVRRLGFQTIVYYKIVWQNIGQVLKKIVILEKLSCNEKFINALAQASDGDMRFALITLESLDTIAVGRMAIEDVEGISKDRPDKLFELLDSVFGGKGVFSSDGETILPWIFENVSDRYSGDNLSNAYRCLGLAQYASVRRLDGYISDFLSLLPRSMSRIPYKQPLRIFVKNSSEIIPMVHCSSKKAIAYMPLIRGMMQAPN